MKKKFLIVMMLVVISILIAGENERFFYDAQQYYLQGDYEKAEHWFKLSMQKTVITPEHHYWLGKTYIALQEYELAYQHLSLYAEKNLGADNEEMTKVLEIIENQIDLTKSGNNIYTLGKIYGLVNSEYSDLAPVLAEEGKVLYFTSYRNADLDKENIFMSKKVGFDWTKPVLVKELSTNKNESLGSITEDGEKAYLFGNYLSNKNMGDIYMTRKSGKTWEKPSLLSGINTEKIDFQPYVFEDKIMFFSSSREGGYGLLDIYVSEYMGGSWTEPENLGSVINTEGYEQTPFLDWDGNTLYFASNGHPGLGGLDLFKTEKIGESWQEWSEPENLGLIVNSVKDDRYFYRSPYDDTEAYIVSNRFDGKGHDDIYRLYIAEQEEIVIVEEVEPVVMEVQEIDENLAMRETIIIENINFEFDKADLLPESFPILDDLVQKFAEYPDLEVEINGHTDNIGTKEYNYDLSQRRAQSVVDYLVENGVQADNLTSKGFGEDVPITTNETEDGRAMNRRVEMKVPEEEQETEEIEPMEIELEETEEPMEIEVIEEEEPIEVEVIEPEEDN